MIHTIAQDKVNLAEEQIEDKKQEIDYDTREFTIEFIVSKYLEKDDNNKSELYVPEYQREFVWSYIHQSRLIESIILGLPIPLIFVAEIKETGRLEIVDGSQRIRTLAAFLSNQLRLVKLETLDYLNNFYFRDLSLSRQRKFKNTPMRMIVLSEKADEDVRNDMFSRINTGGVDLRDMERRKGIYRGEFMDFIFECAEYPLLRELCAINQYLARRYEEAELVLRFFALSDTYPHFAVSSNKVKLGNNKIDIARFLDEYVIEKNKNFSNDEREEKRRDYIKMLKFIKGTFPSGFKQRHSSKYTSRPYFEAISVGSFLALETKPKLSVRNLWKSNEVDNTSSSFYFPIDERHPTYQPKSIIARIDYVKDILLKHS